ncbi:MAG: hypothetical protein NT007_16760 [Candidatus Kapabacteria bacterium]|nr:hypothetical protein [Candidatus Kapabacteria bacterium]
MRKKLYFGLIGLLFLIPYVKSTAQVEIQNDEIANILKQSRNYRYGDISVLRLVSSAEKLKPILQKSTKTAGPGNSIDDCFKTATPEEIAAAEQIKYQAREFLKNEELDVKGFMTGLRKKKMKPLPTDALAKCLLDFISDSMNTKPQEFNGYIITNRINPKATSFKVNIIGFIAAYTQEGETANLITDLKNVDPNNVFSHSRLESYYIKMDGKDSLLKGFLEDAVIRQWDVVDVTQKLQNIDDMAPLVPKKYGVTTWLVDRPGPYLDAEDIPKFTRITEGLPEDYKPNLPAVAAGVAIDTINSMNEITVGNDIIRWRNYEIGYLRDKSGNIRIDPKTNQPMVDPNRSILNDFFPKFGFELKYGNENINMPSLWSQRLALSGYLEGWKLGVILPPTDYANSMSKSFGDGSKLAYTNFGIVGSVDFPIKMFNSKSIFNLSASGAFGEPKDFVNKQARATGIRTDKYNIYADYIPRFDARLLYTFGVKIGENTSNPDDYQLRFGIGGAVYSVDTYSKRLDSTVIDPKTRKPVEYTTFWKETDKFIGGITAKIDFLAKSKNLPLGITMQYFDESILSDIWAQKTLIDDALFLRFDLNFYYNLKINPRAWENTSLIQPALRLIILY